MRQAIVTDAPHASHIAQFATALKYIWGGFSCWAEMLKFIYTKALTSNLQSVRNLQAAARHKACGMTANGVKLRSNPC